MSRKVTVKPQFIGATTKVKNLGTITIREDHAEILAREGRFDLVDGITPAKKLVALSDKSLKELNDLAKDMEGYKKGLKKEELIELIRATPKPQ